MRDRMVSVQKRIGAQKFQELDGILREVDETTLKEFNDNPDLFDDFADEIAGDDALLASYKSNPALADEWVLKSQIVNSPSDLSDFITRNNISSDVDVNYIITITKGRRDLCESILLSTKEVVEAKTIQELVDHFKIAEVPEKNSLSNYQTRIWYKWQKSKIPQLIDKNLSLKEQAQQAFDLRNEFRTRAREYMSDQNLASFLEENEPNLTFENLVSKLSKSLEGDDIYKRIIETSSHGREEVDNLYKLNTVQ